MVNWKDFEVGKRVVCVNDEDQGAVDQWVPIGSLDGLTKGKIYTIRKIEEDKHPAYKGELSIFLKEIIRPDRTGYGEPGYSLDRFRPIDETRIDQFRAMLHNLPKLPVLAY